MRLVRVKELARPGQGNPGELDDAARVGKLRALVAKAKRQGYLRTWRRGKTVWDYLRGKKVLAIAAEVEVARAEWHLVAAAPAARSHRAVFRFPGAAQRRADIGRSRDRHVTGPWRLHSLLWRPAHTPSPRANAPVSGSRFRGEEEEQETRGARDESAAQRCFVDCTGRSPCHSAPCRSAHPPVDRDGDGHHARGDEHHLELPTSSLRSTSSRR